MEDNFEKIKDMTVEEFFNAFVDLLVSKKDKETIKEKDMTKTIKSLFY